MDDQDFVRIYLHLASNVYIFTNGFHIWKNKLIKQGNFLSAEIS